MRLPSAVDSEEAFGGRLPAQAQHRRMGRYPLGRSECGVEGHDIKVRCDDRGGRTTRLHGEASSVFVAMVLVSVIVCPRFMP